MKLWFFKDRALLELRDYYAIASTVEEARALILATSNETVDMKWLADQLERVDAEPIELPVVIDVYDNIVGRAWRRTPEGFKSGP